MCGRIASAMTFVKQQGKRAPFDSFDQAGFAQRLSLPLQLLRQPRERNSPK